MPRADLPTLVAGYEQAWNRWEVVRCHPEPLPAFFALFECLAWTYVVDDFLKKPDQTELRALRFARNVVHHQWGDALYLTEGAEFPIQFPMAFFEFRWRELPDDRRRQDPDRPLYQEKLVGVPARSTMLRVRDFFAAQIEN